MASHSDLEEETLTLQNILSVVDHIYQTDPIGYRLLYHICQVLNLYLPQIENLTSLAFFVGDSSTLVSRVRLLCEAVLSFPPPIPGSPPPQ